MRFKILILTAILLVLFISILQGHIIYVPTDSSTIQSGINGAVDGDTVMVLPGTYYEHDIDFLGKAITVMSNDPLDPAVVASTVINANAQGRVFYFHNGEDTTSVLSGFTISGGYEANGGGIRCRLDSSPTITRNVITGNIAGDSGGGMSVTAGACPIIAHNVITNNSVVNAAGVGGGIFITTNCPLVVSNNVISGNSVPILGSGGGITSEFNSVPRITGCTITNNSAYFGGGLDINYGSYCEVSNTIFWNNDGGGYGDEVYIQGYLSVLTIDYSNVDGGQASILLDSGCTLNWGDGMVDTIPSFGSDGYHLNSDSPLRNAGDPEFSVQTEKDIDGERRVMEGRVDIGVDEIKAVTVDPPVINTTRESKTLE
jgi:hypothetical protein